MIWNLLWYFCLFLDANYTCCTFHTCWVESGNGTTYSSYLSRREVNLKPRNVDINSIGQCERKKLGPFLTRLLLPEWLKGVCLQSMESTTIEMPPSDGLPHEGAVSRYPYRMSGAHRDTVIVAKLRKYLTPQRGIQKCVAFHFVKGYKAPFPHVGWKVEMAQHTLATFLGVRLTSNPEM